MSRDRSHAPAIIAAASAVAALILLAHTVRRLRAPRHEQRPDKRRQPSVSSSSDSRAPVDNGFDHQKESSGVGELTHRRYSIEVPRSTFSRPSLIQEIERRVHELSPTQLAAFEKTSGEPSRMLVGDEYDITMLGPWNGSVRVAEVTDDSFTLVTLTGHPEAGHICFSVKEHPHQSESFTVMIESWARARDKRVHVAYDTLSVGQQVQTEVWVTFLQRVAELTGCKEVPEVQIDTEELIR